MRLEEWLVADSRLDEQQYEIYMSEPGNSMVIAGNAGSGKTVLAVLRAKRVSNLGSFVLLVFNKALKAMLEFGFMAQQLSADATIYAWAWENRGMDLSGLVFFPITKNGENVQYLSSHIYLQKGDRIEVYKKSDHVRKSHYAALHAAYLRDFKTLTPEEIRSREAEITRFVSVDFADWIGNAYWQTYGRRTCFYELEKILSPQELRLTDSTKFESLSSAILFVPFKFKKDFMILDEAQDFQAEQIESLRSDFTKSIVFFGDTSQKLSTSGTSINAIAKTMACEYVELQKNYRVTKEIARLAEYMLPDDERTLVRRCNKDWGNALPVVKKCKSLDEQIDFILGIIKAEDLTDVAILVPTNKMVEIVVKKMNEKGMDSQYRYNRPLGGFTEALNDFMSGELGGGYYNQIDNLNFQSTLPCVLTYHSSKGTQFETVFIPFANDSMHFNGIKKNAFYVAMTRASRELYLTYEDKLTSAFAPVPVSCYRSV
ncbi:3'-5' exonuclease [Mucilaginibacter aquatilis]|uniref:UvrD-like helicase C-terminal domain-containing protein n=1 Tax=Mucilaginibacter aquatilis TaxID=1517760 RepID=A0A6I4I8L6_9SPHI|nr:3'-5' exonuclease [Mucilaginibacter aquatilis]MVN91471.1 hypothetical protein [Mucilaginibacter aquatilis]